MTGEWPTASIDNIARLRAMAAGVSGAAVTERLVHAPFEKVWEVLSDFEGGFGEVETDMRGVTVSEVDGERVELLARSRFGMRARLRGVHREGWFWAQSRFLIVAVAAVPVEERPEGAATRVAMTGGIRVPGRAALLPVGVRRAARGALGRLAALVEER